MTFDESSAEDSNARDSLVPKAVVSRLSLYLREVQHLHCDGQQTISSSALGRSLGVSAAQVRKDLAWFGQFGYSGIGYRCVELIDHIKKILGTDRVWPVVLVGCGNMGQALLGYRGFSRQGFDVVGAIDVDPGIVGRQVQGLTVEHMDSLDKIVRERDVRVAILAVPANHAPAAAERIVASGIRGILNFAPVTLSLPDHVSLMEVDLAMELEQLAFSVFQNRQGNSLANLRGNSE